MDNSKPIEIDQFNGDLISRKAVLEKLDRKIRTAYPNEYYGLMLAHDIIDDAPAVEAEPVRHCSWCEPGEEQCGTCVKFFRIGNFGDKCSAEYNREKCDFYSPIGHCPNCGAKMDGGTP